MKLINKIVKHNKVLCILIVLYFLFRIINILIIPIFNDEAIYLDWGWKEVNISKNAYFSLAYGNQPFLMWVFGVCQSFFPDPLFAGRIVSVVIGLATMLGIYKIGKEWFSKEIGLLGSVFYILIPFFAFFDRQALLESGIAAIGVWSCFVYAKLLKRQEKKHAAILGLLFGIGFFVKSSALLFVFSFILMQVVALLMLKKKPIIEATIVVLCTFFLVSMPMLTHPLFSDGFFRVSATRSLSFAELLKFPIGIWQQTIFNFIEISFWQLTPIIFIGSTIGVYLTLKEKTKRIIAYWFLISLGLIFFLARGVSPRYVVAFLPLCSLFFAYSIFWIWSKQRVVAFCFGGVAVLFCFWVTYLLIFYPLLYFSLLSRVTVFSQKSEYITAWPSGYGIIETKVLLESIVKREGKIYVGVRPDFGNPESAMFAYFNASKTIRPTTINVDIIKPWIKNEQCIGTNLPMYFVSRDNQMADLENYIEKELGRFYKPEKKSYIGIYKLKICPRLIKKV